MGFKELYSKAKTSGERDELIYQYAIKQQKPRMVPITIPGPNNTKITLNVMQDFFTIEGIRVSPSPPTAQRIAKYFGMELPTAKIADLIYKNSNKIPAKPLSGTGVTIDNKKYSPEEVVSNLINNPKANIAYNDVVVEQLKKQNIDPSKPVDGFAKTIVQPELGKENKAAYYGIWTDIKSDKPVQGGIGTTPHDLTHQEYIAWLRGVDNNVIITKPDGTSIKTNIDKLLRTKELSSAVTFSPGKGSSGYLFHKEGPPPGYVSAKLDPSIKNEAESFAKSILNKPMGTEMSVTLSNGKTYIAKVERHSNKPKGVSLYEPKSVIPTKSKETTVTQPKKTDGILDKIQEFLNSLSI